MGKPLMQVGSPEEEVEPEVFADEEEDLEDLDDEDAEDE
jgi:hypothetical protein